LYIFYTNSITKIGSIVIDFQADFALISGIYTRHQAPFSNKIHILLHKKAIKKRIFRQKKLIEFF